MNTCALTSFLFLIPATYAGLVLPNIDVMLACFMCFLTSFIYHGHGQNNDQLRLLDVLVVRLIALIYTVHTIISMRLQGYAVVMYLIGLTTLAWYVYMRANPNHVPDGLHCLVHVFAVCGIIIYIRGRSKYLAY
jgi:hypothetical protein